MSADFEKVLVKDPRLDVSDSIKYAVIKGGQNVTMAPYRAISATNSQIVFNIQVPSEQTIIDRRVLLQTELSLTIVNDQKGTTVEGGADYKAGGCYYGVYSALAAFPLHQLFTVMSATVNNNTVSINIRDALPVITRLLCNEDLVWYNGSTPTYNDFFASYTPQWGPGWSLNYSNGAIWATDATRLPKRGSFPPIFYDKKSDNSEEYFTWLVTEPLLLSPFIFGNCKANNQGFYGIQNMNFVFNVGDTSRVFRGMESNLDVSGNVVQPPSYDNPSPQVYLPKTNPATSVLLNGIKNVLPGFSYTPAGATESKTANLFNDTQLLFNFLTPHPSDLLPARNIVSFYELPRYITSQDLNLEAKAQALDVNIKNPNTVRFSTNTLQLNQIPDKLICYVRKASGYQSWGDPDVALPIKTITINFNNNSGILASSSQVQLWQMARDNGLTSSYLDWTGSVVTSVYDKSSTVDTLPPRPLDLMKSNPTVGSYLVLEFGKDIQLTEDFYAAGSLGNFNIQVQLDVYNTASWAAKGKYEIVLVTMNSGVFVCERGTSSTYTGILTKQDVLEASQQEHYTHDDVERLVGAGFFDKIKSGISKLASKGKEMAMEKGKELAKKHGHKLLEKGKEMASEHGKKLLEKYTS
jgi:hypothetical protein